MYIFIDSTEYRRFLSPEPDLKTLRNLEKILKTKPKRGQVRPTLILTDQILDEYYRAESQRTEESRTTHTKKEFFIKFDRLGKEETIKEKGIDKKAKELQSSFEKLRDDKVKDFDKKIEEVKQLIKNIFSLATHISCDEKIFRNAEMRVAKEKTHLI